jgi:glyoxylate reductase
MSQTKPKVILTRKLPETIETRMRELFDATLNDSDKSLSLDELEIAVKTADVLVPTVTDKVDADLIAKAGSQLRLIASFGTGVDHIDLAAAKARGITVTNTPGVLTEDTADVTMALILAVPRRIAEGDALARSGQWQGWSPTGMLGHRINGKRLGIVGMGQIGEAVARRARGFGLSVHYHNRKPVHPETEAELEATYWESLEQMLARVDIVSVNCPHTPATNHLLSRERLSLMQRSAYLVIHHAARWLMKSRLLISWLSVISLAPGLMFIAVSRKFRLGFAICQMLFCCPISDRRPLRGVCKWVTR